jgi:hypothetical protein
MEMIERLSKAWAVDREAAKDILARLDAKKWAGGESITAITHAGTIDSDITADKFHGHTGFWISDGEYIALVTNGDPVWSSLEDEDACLDAGLQWGEAAEMLQGYEV